MTDEDEDEIEFLDEDKPVNKKTKNKFLKKGTLSSVFASADEFATLLEDEGQSKVKPGGSNVFANRDNARTYRKLVILIYGFCISYKYFILYTKNQETLIRKFYTSKCPPISN